VGDPADGTMLLQAPAEMLALLDGRSPGEPAKPPPAPPERHAARPPALPLAGSIYGKPRRRPR
jgi:hypothetical protein